MVRCQLVGEETLATDDPDLRHGQLDGQDVALGLVADLGFEGEGLGNEVAEGVGGVGAVFVGFVEFAGDGAVRFESPGDFL